MVLIMASLPMAIETNLVNILLHTILLKDEISSTLMNRFHIILDEQCLPVLKCVEHLVFMVIHDGDFLYKSFHIKTYFYLYASIMKPFVTTKPLLLQSIL
jgi:hypothetical protein